MKTRTCRHPGCEVSWPVAKTAGRPGVWCDEHGTTKNATRRNRAEPRAPKPKCCPPRGKCPQHKREQNPKRYVNNTKATLGRNRQVLDDFVQVFGYATILSETGKPIYTWLPWEE